MDLKYPGDEAEPKDVAKYFEAVALSYGIPGILPVMTSYVELTDAWTGAGDVKDVPGYLNAVDHWSVGYFQQQYDGNPDGTIFGWGTYEQLINAEYAVQRFCEEAVKFIDDEWHANTTDPDALGRWCQAVQRSALPDAYRDKGYPAALELLVTPLNNSPKYPTFFTYVDEKGYVKEWDSGKYIRAWGEKNAKFKTDAEGWYYVPDFQGLKWSWPEANAAPIPGSAWYVERHPTRYFWRPDVESWARYLVDNYNVWCNTYWEHPEGFGFDPSEADPAWLVQNTSLDVWAKEGRGYGLNKALGDSIHAVLFNAEGLPDIDWIIWQGWMWTAAGGWEWFSNDTSDADMGHWKHIHVTFK